MDINPNLNSHTSTAGNGVATCFGVLFVIAIAPGLYEWITTILPPLLEHLYGREMGEIAIYICLLMAFFLAFFLAKTLILGLFKLLTATAAIIFSN